VVGLVCSGAAACQDLNIEVTVMGISRGGLDSQVRSYARKQHFADVEFTEFAFKVSSIEGANPLLDKDDVAVVRSDFMHDFSGLCVELQNARTPCTP
jgi:hypothetical protein